MATDQPIQVGITGGIGAGKSIVAQIFQCLGIPVYNSDNRAKWLIRNDPNVSEAIKNLLGAKAYDTEGNYNREYVSSLVFKDSLLLSKLNQIVHPAVHRDRNDWAARNSEAPYLLSEAAIMNRAGEENPFKYIVVVTAPKHLRIKRVLQRDLARTEEEVLRIINQQVSDKERMEIADFVIENNDEHLLIPNILKLHRIFQ